MSDKDILSDLPSKDLPRTDVDDITGMHQASLNLPPSVIASDVSPNLDVPHSVHLEAVTSAPPDHFSTNPSSPTGSSNSSRESRLMFSPSSPLQKEITLPERSRDIYEKRYEDFLRWAKDKDYENDLNEKVLHDYFTELSQNYAPSSLWSIFSCLKRTLLIRKSIDVTSWTTIQEYIKRLEKDSRKKKAPIFEPEQVHKFLDEAPNEDFLLEKLAFLLGLYGGLRTSELCMLRWQDISEQKDGLQVSIPPPPPPPPSPYPQLDVHREPPASLTSGFAFYVAQNENPSRSGHAYFIKYKGDVMKCGISTVEGRLFLQKRQGKYTRQVLGKAWFAELPKKIASFLGYEMATDFTGHSIRRTSAVWLSYVGLSPFTVQRFGRWKNSAMVSTYIPSPETPYYLTCKNEQTRYHHPDEDPTDMDGRRNPGLAIHPDLLSDSNEEPVSKRARTGDETDSVIFEDEDKLSGSESEHSQPPHPHPHTPNTNNQTTLYASPGGESLAFSPRTTTTHNHHHHHVVTPGGTNNVGPPRQDNQPPPPQQSQQHQQGRPFMNDGQPISGVQMETPRTGNGTTGARYNFSGYFSDCTIIIH